MAYHPYQQSESRGSQSDNRVVEEPFYFTPVKSPYEEFATERFTLGWGVPAVLAVLNFAYYRYGNGDISGHRSWWGYSFMTLADAVGAGLLAMVWSYALLERRFQRGEKKKAKASWRQRQNSRFMEAASTGLSGAIVSAGEVRSTHMAPARTGWLGRMVFVTILCGSMFGTAVLTTLLVCLTPAGEFIDRARTLHTPPAHVESANPTAATTPPAESTRRQADVQQQPEG
jgi:hypothetical protein